MPSSASTRASSVSISPRLGGGLGAGGCGRGGAVGLDGAEPTGAVNIFSNSAPNHPIRDRKSTRLNSSHLGISYAVFCLKKKRNASGAEWMIDRGCYLLRRQAGLL